MITVVVGKEIEKIKGDFESYLNGLDMVGEILYSRYSELYDEGVKQIQRAYELGKSETESENAELKKKIRCECTRCVYSDSPCIRSDYGVENDEDVCPNYENVFVAYTQCKKENAKLRKDREELCHSISEGGKACVYLNEQITKAKEIIKDLCGMVRELNKPNVQLTNVDYSLSEAEAFLNSEVDK